MVRSENTPFSRKESLGPEEIVEPVRQLVAVASGRVRSKEGELDWDGERGRLVLETTGSVPRKILDIRDYAHPQATPLKSSGGLFVSEIILDNQGNPVEGGLSLQLPTSEESVTRSRIYILRDIPPEGLAQLTTEIQEGRKIPLERADDAMRKLNERATRRNHAA